MDKVITSLKIIKYKMRDLFLKKNREIQKFQDSASNSCCFIIATGPSLTLEDIELLQNEVTFSMNSIVNVFDKIKWRPSYYTISDGRIFHKVEKVLEKEHEIPIFFGDKCNILRKLVNKENSFRMPRKMEIHPILNSKKYYTMSEKKRLKYWKFSKNASKYLYDGPSVMYLIFQIAVYMGYKEIYLIGADASYSGGETHSKVAEYNMSKETLHPKIDCQLQDMYRALKHYSSRYGFKIFNATRGGALEEFPRVKLEDILNVKKEMKL